jgi:hypothetical protein
MFAKTILTAVVCVMLLSISACTSPESVNTTETPQVVTPKPKPPVVEVPPKAEEPPQQPKIIEPQSPPVHPEIPLVQPEDDSEVVVAFRNSKLTMNQVNLMHPNPTDFQIANLARSWLLNEILLAEAVKRGIPETPKGKFVSEMMRRGGYIQVLQGVVKESVQVTDQEVLDEYQKRGQIDPRNRGILEFAYFQANTLEEAQKIIERLKAGESIEKVGNDDYEDIVVESPYPRAKIQYPVLFQKLSESDPGQIVEPVKTASGKYEVAKIIRNEKPGILPFDEVKDKIVARLKRRKADQAFKDLIKTLQEQATSDVKKSPRFEEIEKEIEQQRTRSRERRRGPTIGGTPPIRPPR